MSHSVVPILTARMGSARLPGKTLLPVGPHTVLSLCVRRLQHSRWGERLVVAVPESGGDDALAAHAEALGAQVFRGSETDVLSRFAMAGRAAAADIVVRLTGDCPLNDPVVVDACVDSVLTGAYDYVTTKYQFPMGIDCEVMTRDVMERLDAYCRAPEDREHVTRGVWTGTVPCRTATLPAPEEMARAEIVLTLDDASDYERLKGFSKRLGGRRLITAGAADFVAMADRHPELMKTRTVPRGLDGRS